MKPSLRFSPLPGIIGFAAMAAVGWLIPHAAPSSPVQKDTSNNKISRDRGMTRDARPEGVVAAQVRAIRSAGSAKERLRSTAALAKSIPPTDFAAWVEGDRFDFREGPELSVFRMILFERWINESPETLIPWAGKNNYGQAGRALLALAKDSPAVLLDHYRSHPGDAAELQVLAEVGKNHPALALQRFQELSADGLTRSSGWQISNLIEQLSLKSPAALEAAMDTLPPGPRGEAEKQLCMRRLETSFDTELKALFERPDGANLFTIIASQKTGFAEKLLDHLAHLPEQWKSALAANQHSLNLSSDGARWFKADLEGAGFTATEAKNIRSACLRELASRDPDFVIRNLDNADPVTRSAILARVMNNARGDEAAAEKLIGLLASEEEKQQARDHLINSNTINTPAEWLDHVGKGTAAPTNTYQIFDQLNRWSGQDIGKLREGFKALPDDKKQDIARMVAKSSWHTPIVPAFAGDAIRYIVENPPANESGGNADPVSASSIHAVNLVLEDPAAATEWVNTLPDGEAKTRALKNMATNWNQYDPKAVREWLGTLPAGTRDGVKAHLAGKR